MLDLLLSQFATTLGQVRDQVADIDDTRMSDQLPGLPNHPAWTLDHLCGSAGFALALLDEPNNSASPERVKRCGPGSTPEPTRALYPTKQALLEELATLHDRLTAVVTAKHAAYFSRPAPENLRSFAPTIGTIVFYLMACHESYHVAQLALWRRSAGLKPA